MSQTLPRLDYVISATALVEAHSSETLEQEPPMRRRSDRRTRRLDVDIVIPVYNEEKDLEPSVRRLRKYLDESFPFAAQIVIADNGSTDRTPEIASTLSRTLEGVRLCALDQKGKGLAVRTAWSQSSAEVVAYMDVDLSTGLEALLPLVAPLLSGHSDLSIGTRLAKGSEVIRGPKRELISRCYNLMIRTLVHNHFSDACCGFKAMRQETAQVLLPLVADNQLFFDTELLLLAERNGLRIHEVPVDWVDTESGVSLSNAAIVDLKGLGRILREFGRGGGYVPNPDQFRRPVNFLPAGTICQGRALHDPQLLRLVLPPHARHGGLCGERCCSRYLHGDEHRCTREVHLCHARPGTTQRRITRVDHFFRDECSADDPCTRRCLVGGPRCSVRARHRRPDRNRNRGARQVPPVANVDLSPARGVNPDEYTQLAEHERTYWWYVGRLSIIETYLREIRERQGPAADTQRWMRNRRDRRPPGALWPSVQHRRL